MTAATEREEATLELSRAQRWVLHHVLLDRIELEAAAPAATEPLSPATRRAFKKLDDGCTRFTRRERRRLRDEVCRYAAATATPERDRPVAERVGEKLRRSLPAPATDAGADRTRVAGRD